MVYYKSEGYYMKLVFVSSTFVDMEKERELLNVTLFPRMKKILESYGESFFLTPLSFGIKEKDDSSKTVKRKVIEALFHPSEDIKPYMILLLGEKYGWINEKELLKKVVDNDESQFKKINFSNDFEIEYLNLLERKYGDRILFYIRDLDKSEMDDAAFEKYEATSCLEREKMSKLIKEIKRRYPNKIKKYKAKYSKDKNEIILLDNLPLMIENDLKDLFIPTLLEASSLPWQKRARIVPEYFFKEKSKNYFPFISTINEDEEVYLGYKYNEYPFLTIISGERGIGKTSKLAYLYETSKNEKMCFVYCKDQYSKCLTAFIKQLIYKIEDVLNLNHAVYNPSKTDKEKTLNETFNNLIKLLFKHHFEKPLEIYIDYADEKFLSFLLNIQFKYIRRYGEKYYPYFPLRFFIVFNNDVLLPPVNPFFDVSHRLIINRQYDVEVKKNITKKLLKEYKLPFDDDVINAIIIKEESSYPLYLKMVIHRLSYDYRFNNENIDPVASKNNLLELISRLPGNTKLLALYIVNEAESLCDKDEVYKVILCTAYSFKRMTKKDIKNIFKFMNWKFNEDAFDDIINLLSVIIQHSEYTDSFHVYTDNNPNSVAQYINDEIIKRSLTKYLGSLSNYYLNMSDDVSDAKTVLKLAFARIDLACRNKEINEELVNRHIDYLINVINHVLDVFERQNYSKKQTAEAIADIISWAIHKRYINSVLIFVCFANNFIKENPDYTPLFKGFFYYIKTDFSSSAECKKIVDFFDLVFNYIENSSIFGDYYNDFSLWLKIKFTIIKVRYFSIVLPRKAKKELDNLLTHFSSQGIKIPTFYMMQIYATYLIICINAKEKELFEDIFKENVFSYFPFDDPENLKYIKKDFLETIYRAKIYALIALALAKCYGEEKKLVFVPLLDRACETFEMNSDEYELTHFNSATYTALLLAECIATPMYNKDPFVLQSFRYDARKYYPNSYFVLEAEASYYYWRIMMEESDDKRDLYLKYLSRRCALADSSNLLEAHRLYILVYAEFMQYIEDFKDENFVLHLNKFYIALKKFISLCNDEDDMLDSLLVIGEFFEACRIHNKEEMTEKLYMQICNKFETSSELFKNILEYMYKYYVLEEESSSLALSILNDINASDIDKKYTKIKTLFSVFDI